MASTATAGPSACFGGAPDCGRHVAGVATWRRSAEPRRPARVDPEHGRAPPRGQRLRPRYGLHAGAWLIGDSLRQLRWSSRTSPGHPSRTTRNGVRDLAEQSRCGRPWPDSPPMIPNWRWRWHAAWRGCGPSTIPKRPTMRLWAAGIASRPVRLRPVTPARAFGPAAAAVAGQGSGRPGQQAEMRTAKATDRLMRIAPIGVWADRSRADAARAASQKTPRCRTRIRRAAPPAPRSPPPSRPRLCREPTAPG